MQPATRQHPNARSAPPAAPSTPAKRLQAAGQRIGGEAAAMVTILRQSMVFLSFLGLVAVIVVTLAR